MKTAENAPKPKKVINILPFSPFFTPVRVYNCKFHPVGAANS